MIIPDLDTLWFSDKPSKRVLKTGPYLPHIWKKHFAKTLVWKSLMLTMTNIPSGKMITKPGSFSAHHYIKILVAKEISYWKNVLRAADLLALFWTYWVGA